jgi:hypothetical protein
MMLRSTSVGAVLVLAVLLAGCGESKASQCDKLAMTLRGAAKKEMAASAGMGDKSGAEPEIVRAFKRSAVAVERELDDWQLKRPDKGLSEKGAVTIKAYADAVRAVEAKEPLKASLTAYADAVEAVWEFSKQRVEADTHDKGHQILKQMEVEEQKVVAWCAN